MGGRTYHIDRYVYTLFIYVYVVLYTKMVNIMGHFGGLCWSDVKEPK